MPNLCFEAIINEDIRCFNITMDYTRMTWSAYENTAKIKKKNV